jgi:hypothetical protein
MNLSFLNPLFLFGVSAGVIPILIHRLTKRKAIPRKFSAVRLLLQSQRVTSRPQQLKHLLLLALRILTVIGLVFMMAQPVLTRQGFLALGNESPKVLILDNSMSMGYMGEGGGRYDRAKKASKEIIEGIKGPVMIIPTTTFGGRPIQGSDIRWMKPEEALRELDRIPLSFGRGDFGTALSLANDKLKDIKMPGEIVVLSDMARGDWEGFDLNKLGNLSFETGFSFLRIGGPNRDPNFSFKRVRITDGEAVSGVPFLLEVSVSNLSDKPGSPLVQLFLSGEKKDQKSIGLKAEEEGKVYFELLLDRSGWIDGEVKLSGDNLPWDDVFYFSLKVREKVRVLVVDGDPKTSLRAGESYYLVNALHPGGSETSPFLTRVITGEELASLDPRSYEAFFLLNVARPQGSKLSSILESGKPVFLFLGDRVVPEEYNSFPFFPWRIREVRGSGSLRPESIKQIDDRREALRSFSGPEGKGLHSASIRRYFKIEGSTRNLLTLGNGDPLLVEADLGKGRLFLFSSSADLEWNDLPLTGAYLPLIQGLVKETLGLHEDSPAEGLRFGEPLEEKVQPVQVTGLPGGPGIYKFLLPSGEVRHGLNPPLKESDLTKVTEEEIKKSFGKIEAKLVEYREEVLRNAHHGKKEFWPFLLAFVFIVLAIEMGIANRI